MDIIPTPKRSLIMDATLLSSLMSCGRLYDLRYNNNLLSIKGKSNSLEVGSLGHKVFEVYYKHRINGHNHDVSVGQAMTAGNLYVSGCPHCSAHDWDSGLRPSCNHSGPDEYPGLQNTPAENDGRHKTGWTWVLKTCEEYFDYYKGKDMWKPIAAEWVKTEAMYQDDEIRVAWKAKFDTVIEDDEIGIWSMDHKFFKQRRDKSTLNNQFIGQCLLLKSRRLLVNKVGLQTSLPIEQRFTREVVNYSADRLIEWQSEILPYYAYKYFEYVDSGLWPPNFTHCDNVYGPCQFKEVCESNRNMREDVLRMNFVKVPRWDPINDENEGRGE